MSDHAKTHIQFILKNRPSTAKYN